ncbi:N-acetylmuramoyl-L-alanine amidase-like domain-containing protein [Legionella worsleiensis]|uniref:DUF1460 domain-containing protein n=1 Tax=Legionella worsleiensis TaxID=45076 RepID=A0A0W1AFF6_9GAMM|nr:N-acetylmuramoyl-L-alanine amidase-like domain-containing protein [Legionella worsleiensis]KTD80066.1 hypothetical protein Lwor_1580 [Legionella worsleiensis]STY32539.1 Protein of uncharacterised function (DUF1460) [Legionella worsleiensis]
MKYTPSPLHCLLIFVCILSSYFCHAIDSAAIEQQADASIRELYHSLESIPNASITERIDWISEHFKGTPYILGSLGEGPNARYDQFPRYRVDGFDCDTYVNTVLALAVANSLETFKQCLQYTRYNDGKIAYINRNHFTSIDWNRNNQNRGLIKDITLSIKNKLNQPVALYTKTMIDKPGWYAHKTKDTIRWVHENKSEQAKCLSELQKKGHKLKATLSVVPYIPLNVLFTKDGTPDRDLFNQIPSGSIVEIVRINWNIRHLIGTSLNISHLGFAIRKNDQLYFRQASSQHGKVVDVPLIDYLNAAQKSPTIKGINIQVLIPKKPITHFCKNFKSDLVSKK